MARLEQDYKYIPVRTAAITTNSYVAGTVIEEAHLSNQLIVLAQVTLGSLDSVEIRVRFGPDNSTWYQETFQAIAAGTATETLGEHTIAANGNYRIPVEIKDRYIEIAVKGTGTVTSSSVAVSAILGVD